MTLRILLLGPLRVELDGRPIAVDTRKALALLAYLALNGEPQGRSTLATLLWADYDDSNARAALRRTLSVLNRALDGQALLITRDAVGLAAAEVEVDVQRFRALVRECGEHGHAAADVCPRCVAPLAEAASLYRGDFLAGFALRDSIEFEDWQYAQSEQLRREFDAVLERLTQCHQQNGDLDAGVACAHRRLQLDPINEAAHAALIRLYALKGDRTAALRQYRDCLRVLQEELGVAPLEETTHLYEAVSTGALPGETPATRPPAPAAAPSRPALGELPLVGRDPDLRMLVEHYERHTSGASLIVIEGEAGIGKTRLLREFAAAVRERGGALLTAQCYEGGGRLAYEPVLALLKGGLALDGARQRLSDANPRHLLEASRLAPEYATLQPLDEAPPSLDAPGGEARFYNGLMEVLSRLVDGDAPGVIVVDDAHWADESSLDLLSYLLRRQASRPLHLLLTWRAEEIERGHRLPDLLLERERHGAALHVGLHRLDAASVHELVQAAALSVPTEDVEQRLQETTDGLPLYLVQYLAAIKQASDFDWSLPAGLHDLLRSRLSHVGETDQQVLTTAAVLGRAFDFDVLWETSGRSEDEVIGAIEALVGQGFLRPATLPDGAGDVAYDFAHESLRTLVYEETSPVRRRRLHGRAGDALARRAQRSASVAAQVGQHYRLAGRDQDAAAYFRLAGQQARTVHANAEALAHFTTALAAGYPDTAPLHAEIGAILTLDGAYGAALTSYQTAAALSDADHLPTIEHRIGGLYLRLGAWALAEQHLNAALAEFRGRNRTGSAARALADLSLAAHRQGQGDRAATLADEAIALARDAGDGVAEAQAHNVAGIVASSAGDLEAALAHLHVSLALAEQAADPSARIAALNNLSLALVRRGDLATARSLTETAIALCAEYGDRHREAALRNNLADLARAEGNDDEAMANLKQAVAIFSEIGSEMGDLQPEVWKLVEW